MNTLLHLLREEDGSAIVETALFAGFLVAAGMGFFCFSAGQFRDVFQSSYQIK